jgi:murein DD-endopeptidase MepM/ murein hydrolase activator NlpD
MTNEINTNPELVGNTTETTTENPDINGERAVQQVTDFVGNLKDDGKAKTTTAVADYIESHDDCKKGWGDFWEFVKEVFGDMEDIQLILDEDTDDEIAPDEDENANENEHNPSDKNSGKQTDAPAQFIEQIKGHFHWPVIGRISSPFGKRNAPKKGASTYHKGIDIAAPAGTPINPTQSGTISKVGYDSKSGHYIKINHPDGTQSVYCHLQSKPLLKAEQDVSINTPIGKVGSTGVSTGPHLHFEIRYNGEPLDPEKLLAD